MRRRPAENLVRGPRVVIAPIRDDRVVAIGMARSGRHWTIALQECDRRAAGAVRRSRTAEFGRLHNSEATSPSSAGTSASETRSRLLTAPLETCQLAPPVVNVLRAVAAGRRQTGSGAAACFWLPSGGYSRPIRPVRCWRRAVFPRQARMRSDLGSLRLDAAVRPAGRSTACSSIGSAMTARSCGAAR